MRRAYARVSGQGQDLDTQIKLLKKESYHELYYEKKTGTSVDARPEFERLLRDLQPDDTLIVTKLDRFARNMAEAVVIIKDLLDRGINVHVLDMGLLQNTIHGQLQYQIIAAFAEFERNIIVQRLNEGKEAAKARKGDEYIEGRPKKHNPKKMQAAIMSVINGEKSYDEASLHSGIPRRTLARAIAEYKKGKEYIDRYNIH